jgi:mono/diheme cytochrome c family protein
MIKKACLLITLFAGVYLLVWAQEDPLAESMKRGEEVYTAQCASCHMPVGEGVEAVYPPLANTDYLKNQKRAIDIILKGQSEEITVNGKQYNVPMEAMSNLTDKEIADVLNYVSNSWGNKYPMIKPAQVLAQRK